MLRKARSSNCQARHPDDFVALRLLSLALSLILATSVSACTRSAQTNAANNACDAAKAQSLQKQGYDLLSRGKWYDAHLVGHALVSIGSNCNRAEIAAPAMIHGVYILGFVAHQVGDTRQARRYVDSGLAMLSKLKEQELDNATYGRLYDEMEPRLLELQAQVQ